MTMTRNDPYLRSKKDDSSSEFQMLSEEPPMLPTRFQMQRKGPMTRSKMIRDPKSQLMESFRSRESLPCFGKVLAKWQNRDDASAPPERGNPMTLGRLLGNDDEAPASPTSSTKSGSSTSSSSSKGRLSPGAALSETNGTTTATTKRRPVFNMRNKLQKEDSSWRLDLKNKQNNKAITHRRVCATVPTPTKNVPVVRAPLNVVKPHCIIGEGTFSQVWLVSVPSDNDEDGEEQRQPYAFKVQSKYELVQGEEEESVFCEKNVLKALNHPFIVGLSQTYQDVNFVYHLLEYCPGGELTSRIYKDADVSAADGLSESDAKFYVYCVAHALAHMHKRHYVFRDLKPGNIVLDAMGYPVLVDFGFAKYLDDCDENKTFTLCGSPAYIPPEALTNAGHSYSADYWSLGVVLHECLAGDHPFYSDGISQMDLFQSIIEGDYRPPREAKSDGAKDILRGLLQKNPDERLGALGSSSVAAPRRGQAILGHEWFAGSSIDAESVLYKKTKAPWVPVLQDRFDARHFEDLSDLDDMTREKFPRLARDEQDLFKDF